MQKTRCQHIQNATSHDSNRDPKYPFKPEYNRYWHADNRQSNTSQ